MNTSRQKEIFETGLRKTGSRILPVMEPSITTLAGPPILQARLRRTSGERQWLSGGEKAVRIGVLI